MINWIIKIFALLSVVALALGLAAEFTSLLGDVRSLSSKPTSTTDRPMGILMVRATKSRSSKKPLVCEAYKWGTDFPQRPGAIFHGALYHVLSVGGIFAMLAHQILRALSPAMLPMVFSFVPSLQGAWGLSGSGAVMIYLSLQIMSYSIGKIHVIASVTLFLVGCLNLCGGFVAPIASAEAFDPYADPYGGQAPPDDPYPDERGGAGAPMDGDGAPDPYDGKDPGAFGAGMDGGEGVGASAPPPGMLEKGDDVKTFGGIPAGVPPPVGYAPGNAETNPAMLYPGATGGAPGGDITFDPSTGMWTSVPGSSPATTLQHPGAAMMAPSMPMMPMGYDMFGRPIMAPNPMAAPAAAMPGMYNPGWPGVMPPQPALMGDNSSVHSKKSSKKAAKREARKEYKKLRQEEEEEEERERRKEARRRQKEYEKQVRREEKRQQNVARAVAMQDAQQRSVQEVAVEDARQRKYQATLEERRQEAMAEAQRQAYERDQEYRREQEAARRRYEAQQEREREQLMHAREKAEQDAMEMERHDQRKGMQNQALAAAQQAVGMGDPLPRPVHNRGSYRSQAGSMPPYLRNPANMQMPQPDQYSQRSAPHPLAFPGQRSLAASTVQRAPSPTPPGYSPYAYSRSKTGTHLQPPPMQHHRPDAYGGDEYGPDDDDAMTEIRSVRSETSSQRRLVQRRMEEERERVLQAQERDRAMQQPYGDEEEGYGDVLDDYRSGRSGRSGGSSMRRHRPAW